MLEKLKKQLADIQARAKTIIESEERSEAAQANLDELLAEGDTIKARIAELEKLDELTAAGAQLDSIVAGTSRRQAEKGHAETRDHSVGEAFTRSEVYTEYAFRGTSSRAEIPFQARALHTTTTIGLGDKDREILANPPAVTPLLDVIGYRPTTKGSVEFVKYLFDNKADVVAEGAMKPESGLSRTIVDKSIPTVAHWVEVTRQELEDDAQVRAILDNELTEGVLQKIEDLAAAAINGGNFATVADANLLAAIRLAKAKVPKGYMANAVLLNPDDWAGMDINAQAITGNPMIQQIFWGLTPVSAESVPSGSAFVGDLKRCVRRIQRTTASVYITDSDVGLDGKSNFKRNIFTLLGEARSLVEVVDERGVIKATGAVAAPVAAPVAAK